MLTQFKVEVITNNSGGEWVGNALRFISKKSAEEYGSALAARWTAVKAWRVVEEEVCNAGRT